MPPSIFSKYVPKDIEPHINNVIEKYKKLIRQKNFDEIEKSLKSDNLSNDILLKLMQEIKEIKQYIKPENTQTTTLKELFFKFYEHKKNEQVSESSLTKYKKMYKVITEEIPENTSLSDISEAMQQNVINKIISMDASNKTKNELFINIKQMFDFAYKNYYTDKKPFDRIKLLKEKENPYIHFSDKQMREMLSADNPEFVNIVKILIFTGMRVGELASIKKEDINLTKHTIHIRGTKTQNADRTIYIHPKIFPILKEFKNDDSRVYIRHGLENAKDPADALSKWINRNIKKYTSNVIQKKQVVHSFRGMFATRLYSVTEEYIVKYILGHSQKDNVTITHYTDKIPFNKVKDAIIKVSYPYIK